MDALEITARKGTDNRRFYVSLDSVKALDELHKCLEVNGAKLEECAAQVKRQMDNGSSLPETTIPSVSFANTHRQSSVPTTLLQLPEELIQILALFLDSRVDPFHQYDALAKAAREGYYLPTSMLLPLLGRKSIPKLDDHSRFKSMGFMFWKLGKIGNQYQWKVTKEYD